MLYYKASKISTIVCSSLNSQKESCNFLGIIIMQGGTKTNFKHSANTHTLVNGHTLPERKVKKEVSGITNKSLFL